MLMSHILLLRAHWYHHWWHCIISKLNCNTSQHDQIGRYSTYHCMVYEQWKKYLYLNTKVMTCCHASTVTTKSLKTAPTAMTIMTSQLLLKNTFISQECTKQCLYLLMIRYCLKYFPTWYSIAAKIVVGSHHGHFAFFPWWFVETVVVTHAKTHLWLPATAVRLRLIVVKSFIQCMLCFIFNQLVPSGYR